MSPRRATLNEQYIPIIDQEWKNVSTVVERLLEGTRRKVRVKVVRIPHTMGYIQVDQGRTISVIYVEVLDIEKGTVLGDRDLIKEKRLYSQYHLDQVFEVMEFFLVEINALNTGNSCQPPLKFRGLDCLQHQYQNLASVLKVRFSLNFLQVLLLPVSEAIEKERVKYPDICMQ